MLISDVGMPDEDRTQALRAGFNMHLAKPIDPGELLVVIETW